MRFNFYPSREEVKLENKFSAIPMKLPLTDSMEKAYKPIRNITKGLKKEFMMIYTSYAFTMYCQKLLPRFVPSWFLEQASKKFSMGFSNVPGPIKPLYFMSDQI